MLEGAWGWLVTRDTTQVQRAYSHYPREIGLIDLFLFKDSFTRFSRGWSWPSIIIRLRWSTWWRCFLFNSLTTPPSLWSFGSSRFMLIEDVDKRCNSGFDNFLFFSWASEYCLDFETGFTFIGWSRFDLLTQVMHSSTNRDCSLRVPGGGDPCSTTGWLEGSPMTPSDKAVEVAVLDGGSWDINQRTGKNWVLLKQNNNTSGRVIIRIERNRK